MGRMSEPEPQDIARMIEVQRDRHGQTIKVGQFGQYRLGRHLRTYGGQVECFRAEQPRFDRQVEAHILRTSRKGNPTLVDRFLAKVQDMAAIDHPGVMPVLDVDTAGSRAFFTTPVRDSIPLAEHLASRGGTLEPRETVELAVVLAEALSRMHARGILHREISLQSVFWDRGSKTPYFAEFPLRPDGEVVARDAPPPLGLLAGQLWDERSDVFLFSCLLVQLLLGELPLTDLPDLVTGSRLEPPHRALRGVTLPDGFQSVLIVGLEQSESRRYASATDLATDLEECRKNPLVPVVNPDVMDDESAIRQAIVLKQRQIRRRHQQMAAGPWQGSLGAGGAGGSRATVAAVMLASFLFTLPIWIHRARRAEEEGDRVRVVAAARAAAPQVEAARARREALERTAMQAKVRATSSRTFDSRWDSLQQWLATEQGRRAGVCTVGDLLMLRLRHVRGEPAALETLDRWLDQARRSGEGPGA